MGLTDFKNRGWVKFKAEKSMLRWQKYVQPIAEEISFDPKQKESGCDTAILGSPVLIF